jgi:hypothetical protein
MSVSQPNATDKLNNPDHSLMHRQVATDPNAPVKSVQVDSGGNVILLHPLSVAQGGTGSTGASTAFTTYDSGWFAGSGGQTYTKTHSLGTTKVIAQLWFSNSATGASNVFSCTYNNSQGSQLCNLTTTTVDVITDSGTIAEKPGGATYSSGYFRVILIALS